MSGARAPGPEAGAAGAEPPGAALSVDVAGLLAQLARSFALLLPVYALGYLGLSFTWVLLALGLLVWCRRSRGLKATRLCRALALLEDEERAVRLGVRACDLPAWVSGRSGPLTFLSATTPQGQASPPAPPVGSPGPPPQVLPGLGSAHSPAHPPTLGRPDQGRHVRLGGRRRRAWACVPCGASPLSPGPAARPLSARELLWVGAFPPPRGSRAGPHR